MTRLEEMRRMAHEFMNHQYGECDGEHDPPAIAVIELEDGQGGLALLNGETHIAMKQMLAYDKLPSKIKQFCVAAPSWITLLNTETKSAERFEGVLFSSESPGVCEGHYSRLTRENGVNTLGPIAKLEGEASGRLVKLLPTQQQEMKQWVPSEK